VRSINSLVELKYCSFSNVDVDWVLDIHSFSLSKVSLLFGTECGVALRESLYCLPCDPVEYTSGSNLLPPLPQSFERHNKALSSAGFSFQRPFVLNQIKAFLVDLLYTAAEGANRRRNHGEGSRIALESDEEQQIFRMKGILHVDGFETLFILQSVYDVFDLQPSGYIFGEKVDNSSGDVSTSSIIVIGHHLDSDQLLAGFQSCLLPN
jgi:G3E family GTPase